ncbi:class I SAM-dependent methyltransferase [Candidatus Peregrinibacteria bacterium]|nr:class I SAM-dependent methyltransferase [Candidatus Peregrinibacteria bacterium]
MQVSTAQKLLKKVKEDYAQIAEEFDQTRRSDWKEFTSFLPYIKNGDKVYDIGCGNGRLYDFLSKNPKVKYTGFDNNKKLLKLAEKQHQKEEGTICQFKIGDLLKIPAPSNSADATFTIAALHHIPSVEMRKKAILELTRVTKKNGIVIISVWNLFQPKYKKYIWKSRLRKLISFGKYDSRDTLIPWRKSGVRRYYYAFREPELTKLLSGIGLEILEKIKDNNFVFICRKS